MPIGRIVAVPALVAALVAGGCSQSPLGGVLGGILSPAPSDMVSGSVSGVDTRSQQVYITMDNGQQVAVQYDNRTQVTYQGQSYPVTSLERGDYVTARLQGTTGGQYYVYSIEVTQPAQGSTSGGSYGSYIQTMEGNVSQINYQNGTFLLTSRGSASVVVSMPYNPRQIDVQRFNQLRNGDYVRLQGQWVSSDRFQLVGFM